MSQKTHDQVNTAAPGDIPGNEGVKNPGLGWMFAFIVVVSFVGIFSIVILRKVFSQPCFNNEHLTHLFLVLNTAYSLTFRIKLLENFW